MSPSNSQQTWLVLRYCHCGWVQSREEVAVDLSLVLLCFGCMHAQLWPTLCNPMDYSLLGSSVHGVSQAGILEWAATSFSRGPSLPRDWTGIPCISCAGRQMLYLCVYLIRKGLHPFNLMSLNTCEPLCSHVHKQGDGPIPHLPKWPCVPWFWFLFLCKGGVNFFGGTDMAYF